LSDKNVDKNVRAPQATRHHGAAALKYAGPGIWKLEVGVWNLVFGIWCFSLLFPQSHRPVIPLAQESLKFLLLRSRIIQANQRRRGKILNARFRNFLAPPI